MKPDQVLFGENLGQSLGPLKALPTRKAAMSADQVAALRTIIRNDRYVAPSLAALLGSYESRRKKPLDTLSILSLREREVFRLAADCLLTREIARELCISRKTVDTHLYRIHRKLGLRTSAELVRLACNLGLVRRGAARDSLVGDAEALVSEGMEGA